MLINHFKDNHSESTDNDFISILVTVRGRVQGVAFRYYAQNEARRLKVKGWVTNLMNGDVELLLEGKKKGVLQMIQWCKKGPRLAIVEDIQIDWQTYTGKYVDFKIK